MCYQLFLTKPCILNDFRNSNVGILSLVSSKFDEFGDFRVYSNSYISLFGSYISMHVSIGHATTTIS